MAVREGLGVEIEWEERTTEKALAAKWRKDNESW